MMSGTSLDGVDAAIIETDGHNIKNFVETRYISYPESFQQKLRALLGKREISEEVITLTKELMDFHADVFLGMENHAYVDVVGVHGQTLFHQPKSILSPAKTWQIVDPEYLQSRIHKTIVYDFRSEDIRQGGEGAPLVPIYHHALFKHHPHPLAVINIGGVANMTWIKGDVENMMAGDTGPGNALMNDFLERRTGQIFDDQGKIASTGHIKENLLHAWLGHPYFHTSFPKSLDRNTFSSILNELDNISTEDGMRTLLEFTAQSIGHSLPSIPKNIYICGGGRHNQYLMQRLQELFPCPTSTIEEAGFHGDFIEAEAFAFLAMRVIKKLDTSFPKTTGVKHPTCGGAVLKVD